MEQAIQNEIVLKVFLSHCITFSQMCGKCHMITDVLS